MTQGREELKETTFPSFIHPSSVGKKGAFAKSLCMATFCIKRKTHPFLSCVCWGQLSDQSPCGCFLPPAALGIGWAPLAPSGTSLVTHFTVGRFRRLDEMPPSPRPLSTTAATANCQWPSPSDCWTAEPSSKSKASSASSW